MKFGQALDDMRAQRKVKRPGWGFYVFLEWLNGKPAKLMRANGTPSLDQKPADPKPYLPGHEDLLAEDWLIA